MSVWRTLSILTLMLVVTAPGGSDAQTQIYIGEYMFNAPRVYRLEPGGANLEELFAIPDADWLVVGLQFDTTAQKLYWTHGSFGQGAIRRANLDGSAMETIQSGLTNPRGLALDINGGKVYWSDTQDDTMVRCNLDGSGLETIVSTGDQLGRPTLDLANGKIYYGNFTQGDMRRANLDGSSQEILFDGLWTPVAVALDLANGKIYWADSNTTIVSNHIARANLDGSNFEVLFQGCCPAPGSISSGFTGIGLDLAAGKLYWSDEIFADEKGMWEADLDGANATKIFASPSGWNAGVMTLVTDATPPSPVFVRGDCNGDGGFDISDPVNLLTQLFGTGAIVDCEDACDGNDDENLDISDPVSLLASLFTPGAPPPLAPHPTCGPDPDGSALDCASFASCP